MLFYHIKLRCYVVVELKAVSFEPDFAGKLNFYVRNKDDRSYVFKLRNENAQSGNNPADFYISDLRKN